MSISNHLDRSGTATHGIAALIALMFLFGGPLLSGCASQPSPPVQEQVWIDVRTPAEYDGGHVEGALNIPHDAIESGIAPLALARETPVYLYCGSGRRAGLAKQRLEALGFTHVINAGSLQTARELHAQRHE